MFMVPPVYFSRIPLLSYKCTDIGSVWANILHSMYTELVSTFGWSSTALTGPTANEGNVVWLHLLFDALLL